MRGLGGVSMKKRQLLSVYSREKSELSCSLNVSSPLRSSDRVDSVLASFMYAPRGGAG